LVNDVRELTGDPTTTKERATSHRKISFLFLRSALGALWETTGAATFSALLRGKMIFAAMPKSFDHLNGSKVWRVIDRV
jgi:hypothetical protein